MGCVGLPFEGRAAAAPARERERETCMQYDWETEMIEGSSSERVNKETTNRSEAKQGAENGGLTTFFFGSLGRGIVCPVVSFSSSSR